MLTQKRDNIKYINSMVNKDKELVKLTNPGIATMYVNTKSPIIKDIEETAIDTNIPFL